MKTYSYSMFFAVGTRWTLEINRRETTFPGAGKYRERVVDISEGNFRDFHASLMRKTNGLYEFVLSASGITDEQYQGMIYDVRMGVPGDDLLSQYIILRHGSYSIDQHASFNFLEALREYCELS